MKALSLLIILTMLAVLYVPAGNITMAEPAPAVGALLPNPVHEATREEAEQAAGHMLHVPEGAANIRYSYIEAAKDDPESTVLAQAQYEWEGVNCISRVASATGEKDISGVYEKWLFDRVLPIGAYPGRVMYNEGGAGVGLWYDVREEAACSVSMAEGASLQKLMTLCGLVAEWEHEDPGAFGSFPFSQPSDEAAAAAALGFAFKAPEGAEQARYALYAGDFPIGAVHYMLDGKEVAYYAQTGTEAKEPSGIISAWAVWEPAIVGSAIAVMGYDPGEAGLITWFDEAAGINRTVALARDASPEALLAMAQPFVQ